MNLKLSRPNKMRIATGAAILAFALFLASPPKGTATATAANDQIPSLPAQGIVSATTTRDGRVLLSVADPNLKGERIQELRLSSDLKPVDPKPSSLNDTQFSRIDRLDSPGSVHQSTEQFGVTFRDYQGYTLAQTGDGLTLSKGAISWQVQDGSSGRFVARTDPKAPLVFIYQSGTDFFAASVPNPAPNGALRVTTRNLAEVS